MYIDPLVDYTRSQKLIDEKMLSLPETSEERTAIFSYMRYTYPSADADSKGEFDRKLIHSFNDLQFIYENVLQLNTLLGDIIEFPQILYFYSGFFVYNMTKVLSRNPKSYSNIVSGEWLPSSCSSEYIKIKDIFIKNLPLAQRGTRNLKRKERRPDKKRKAVKVLVRDDDPNLDMVPSASDESTENETDTECDNLPANRFAMLRAK